MKFWLCKVTGHRCIDHTRRRGPQVALDDVPECAAPANEGDPLLSRRLRQFVSLPEKPRLIVILRYQEDLAAKEISNLLAMPVAIVKSHLQRSLAMLREKWLGRWEK